MCAGSRKSTKRAEPRRGSAGGRSVPRASISSRGRSSSDVGRGERHQRLRPRLLEAEDGVAEDVQDRDRDGEPPRARPSRLVGLLEPFGRSSRQSRGSLVASQRPCASPARAERLRAHLPAPSRQRESTASGVARRDRPRPKWRSGPACRSGRCRRRPARPGAGRPAAGPSPRRRSRAAQRGRGWPSSARVGPRHRRAGAAGAARGSGRGAAERFSRRRRRPHWLATAKSSAPSPSTSAVAMPRLTRRPSRPSFGAMSK